MLQEYKRKRNFKITPEPSGRAKGSKGRSQDALTFVIQKHDASRLHYDFRLEIDGVMVSWAVPKGPSLNTKDRRLAVMTEDHPMEYSDFEGIIPEKQYGAGEVIIWDQGVYSPDDKEVYSWDNKQEANKRMREALKKGKLTFYLKGEKLEGSWTLVKMQNKEKDWLLIKHNDKFADSQSDITQLDQSVVSGLTLADLQENGADRIWTRSGATTADPKTTGRSTKQPHTSAKTNSVKGKPNRKQKIKSLLDRAKQGRLPDKIEPMVPTHATKPFSKKGWFFEPKLSGVRVIASIVSGAVSLRDENNDDVTTKYPVICKKLSRYQGEFILDGQIVDGEPGLTDLDNTESSSEKRTAIYCVFDILFAEGKNVMLMPLSERKELLESIIEEGKVIRLIASLGTDGDAAFQACVENGLEGVVGKRANSEYKPGVKTRLWSTVTHSSPKNSKVVHIDSVKRTSKETEPSIKRKSKTPQSKQIKTLSDDAQSILSQLDNSTDKLTLELGQLRIPITSLSKVYWPATETEAAITKRNYLQYLAKVSDFLIPHLKDRLITLVRFPNGITGGRFYQKHWDQRLPEFVETATVYTESERKDQNFLMCNNLATLLWLGQIADLEIHTSHTRLKAESDASDLPADMSGSVETLEASIANYPDYIVLDLDPYLYSGLEKQGAEPELHRKGFEKTAEIALLMKEHLDNLKLDSFVKTSGKTGLHLYIPIVRNIDYDRIRAISQIICQQILKEHPGEVTMEWATKNRTGKVFLDHNMNARSKSLASIYSMRTAPEACISTPLDWGELTDIYPTDFNIRTVPERLLERGDLWSDILEHKADLTTILGDEALNTKLPKKRRSHHPRYRKHASNQ